MDCNWILISNLGGYIINRYVGTTNKFTFDSVYKISVGGSRQSIFMFGMDNGTPIYGLLCVEYHGNVVWKGEGNVVASMTDGVVTVMLPVVAYDYICLISAEYLN